MFAGFFPGVVLILGLERTICLLLKTYLNMTTRTVESQSRGVLRTQSNV